MGKKAEALRYAEDSKGLNAPLSEIARTCEEILLSSGLLEDAYRRYTVQANQGSTNLATFRAIAKKYPHKPQAEILRDLIATTPGAEGKWVRCRQGRWPVRCGDSTGHAQSDGPTHTGPGG